MCPLGAGRREAHLQAVCIAAVLRPGGRQDVLGRARHDVVKILCTPAKDQRDKGSREKAVEGQGKEGQRTVEGRRKGRAKAVDGQGKAGQRQGISA